MRPAVFLSDPQPHLRKRSTARGRIVESLFRAMLSLNRVTRRIGLNLGPLLFKKVAPDARLTFFAC